MRKRFITYPRYNYGFLRIIIYIILGIIGFILTIKILFKSYTNNNEDRLNEMLAIGTNNLIGNISILDIANMKLSKPETLLSMSFGNVGTIEYNDRTIKEKKEKEVSNTKIEKKEPIVYIYNTHQTEEYDPGALREYNITPTVYMAANILKKKLSNLGIESIVEDENVVDVLRNNNWKYSESYKASLMWLERAKVNYPSVKYFIDLHRDSVSSSKTINDIPYAKMMFVIGMNHDNYEKNESLMLKLNTYLNEHYEGLMRDVLYAKKNKFNQNFNENVILVEVGGPKNNIEEVQNSVSALGEALEYVIGGIYGE